MQENASATMKPAGDRVVELLSEQRELYRQLSRLADQQRDLITGSAPEQLLAVLAGRQRLVERLSETGRQLKPFQADWRSFRETLDGEQARTIDALVSEVNTLLSGILSRDQADTELLSARKSETHREIGRMKAGRNAGAAYAASAGSGAGADWAEA